METKSEFHGDMAVFIILLLVCFPASLYYYVANKEKRVVCPECRETADTNASVCPNCSTDLDAAANRADDRESAV
jgi:predicted amidophosphoribosyltransferase